MAHPVRTQVFPRTHRRAPREKDPTPRVVSLPRKEDRVDIMRSIIRLREVKLMLDALETEKKTLCDEIGEILDANGVSELKHIDMKVMRIHAERSSIKRELLLENGVGPDIIAAASVTTAYSYVKLEIDKTVGGGGE